MLVNIDREDQLQIARNVYRKAKIQQRNRGCSYHRQLLTSSYRQTLQKTDDKIKLPNIHHRAHKSIDRNVMETRRQSKKYPLDSTKIIDLIKQQISMEKKNYQTISSDKALIIKNSARSSGQTESLQKKLQHRVTEGQNQEVMTPPYKIFRQKTKQGQELSLPKKRKLTLRNQQDWEQQYTPWHFTESQQVCF